MSRFAPDPVALPRLVLTRPFAGTVREVLEDRLFAAGVDLPEGLVNELVSEISRRAQDVVHSSLHHSRRGYVDAVARRDLDLVQRVQNGIAEVIEAELVCCDAFDSGTAPDRGGHAICYWSGAARSLALSYDPLGDVGKHRPDLHRLVAGQFVCTGDEFDPCHRYPACVCDSWEEGNLRHCDEVTGRELPGHAPRGHDVCWLQAWFGKSDLDAIYAFDVDVRERTDFPDGPIVVDWTGDHPEFRYVTDPATGSLIPTVHWSWEEEE